MKIIDLEQGSEAWLAWRKTVITATDCPAILGSSPWSTAYRVWQRKLGMLGEQKSNEAMERGKRLEPILRERFVKKFGLPMAPTVVESTEYEFLGSSLDGLSSCGKYILEIKTGRDDLYKMAKTGIIPPYYFDQMQHQLLVTGAEMCFYKVGHEDEAKDIVIEIKPDVNFAKTFLPKARDFWKCVAFHESPALTESDYKDMNENIALIEDLKVYSDLDFAIKDLEEKRIARRKKIIATCEDQSCICKGIKILKTHVRGRVDYDAIPELQDLDLDKYRKSSSTVWKIMLG